MRARSWGSGSEDPLVVAGEVNIPTLFISRLPNIPLRVSLMGSDSRGEKPRASVQAGITGHLLSGEGGGLSLLFLSFRFRQVVCDKLQTSFPRGRA